MKSEIVKQVRSETFILSNIKEFESARVCLRKLNDSKENELSYITILMAYWIKSGFGISKIKNVTFKDFGSNAIDDKIEFLVININSDSNFCTNLFAHIKNSYSNSTIFFKKGELNSIPLPINESGKINFIVKQSKGDFLIEEPIQTYKSLGRLSRMAVTSLTKNITILVTVLMLALTVQSQSINKIVFVPIIVAKFILLR